MAWRLAVVLAAIGLSAPGAQAKVGWLELPSGAPSGAPNTPPSQRIDVFKLQGPLSEGADPWRALGLQSHETMFGLINALRLAGRAPDVGTVVMRFAAPKLGLSQAREIAGALERLRKEGKHVVAHLNSANAATLLAATGASRVLMAPEGTVLIPGLRVEVTFYKNLLDALGIQADVEAMGRYKSAPESFTRRDMSDPAREALTRLINSLYGSLVGDIARQRGLSRAQVRALLDTGMLTAEEARDRHLIDGLMTWPQLIDQLSRQHHTHLSVVFPKEIKLPDLTSFFGLLDLLTRAPGKVPSTEPEVAVLVASGPIVTGRGGDRLFGGETVSSTDMIESIRAIAKDARIKAVVLRVDSPGGSALASDLIWQALHSLGRTIPIVASLGDVAASGGYYIASAARRIVAEPTTITGSIGVFGGKIVVQGLYNKLGLDTVVISRGKNSGLFSILSPFSPSERQVMRRMLRHTYDTFVNRVAAGRHMSYDAVDRVAQGRVWSGSDAMARGLVDDIGGLYAAIALATRIAGLSLAHVAVVRYPRPKSLIAMLQTRGSLMFAPSLRLDGLGSMLPAPVQARFVRAGRVLAALLNRDHVLAMQPYVVELH